jgi:integrase
MIPRNVCELVDPPKVPRREMRVWTADEARRFLDAVAATNPDGSEAIPHGTIFAFALETGCRCGEILGLRWQDVDLDRAEVRIAQTIQRVPGRGSIVGPPKTDRGRRRIPLSQTIVDLLRRHKARQNAWRLQLGPAWPATDLVFTTPLGQPIASGTLRNVFRRACATAGVPRIRLHDLRHTHATLLLLANIHPRKVADRLGHASTAMTDRYSHVLPPMQDEVVATLDAILGRTPAPRETLAER